MPKKSWIDKLHNSKDLPKIVELNDEAQEHWGGKKMVVPSPMDVFELMKQVPYGTVTTIAEIRKALAKKYNCDIACPLTTGIFTWIVANASEENFLRNGTQLAPYWRTLKANGELNPKYPNGIEEHKKKLEAEGFTVLKKGKKLVVDNLTDQLFTAQDFII